MEKSPNGKTKDQEFLAAYMDFHERISRCFSTAKYDRQRHIHQDYFILDDLFRDLNDCQRILSAKIYIINDVYKE